MSTGLFQKRTAFPLRPSRKLLSLKGAVKLTEKGTTRDVTFTENKLASQEISTKPVATQKTVEYPAKASATESTSEETTSEATTVEKTTESTTEETTAESTTEETTTESTTEEATTKSTTQETTTETTTTEDATTEETTTESSTEGITKETTTESTATDTSSDETTTALGAETATKSSAKLPKATKSWQKYLSKSTPARTVSTHSQNEASGSISPPVLKKVGAATKQPFGYTKHKQSTSKADSKTSNTKKPKSSTVTVTASTPTRNSNMSVNISIDIDIDIGLFSSLNTTSGDSAGTTPAPEERELRYEKKRVVAGVLLVVLVSVSAACAVLLVILPSNHDVRSHQMPDRIALIPSRNNCRPRFYDSSLYMGH